MIAFKIKLTLQNKSIYHTLLLTKQHNQLKLLLERKILAKYRENLKWVSQWRSQVMQYFYVNIDSEGF